ncbi:MAG TPA: hypothetical protein VFR67_10385 [Pilimelia sp.]|nr:hypothetical protein [Pilimelia sp.]
MLTHPRDPECVLFSAADLAGEAPHPVAEGALEKLRAVVRWAEDYLCRPHPELGRKGPVCPYVQSALERGTFYLAVLRGESFPPELLGERLVRYRDWFRELEPAHGPAAQFKTILLVFPDLPHQAAAAVVDATQERLKPRYVGDGLMIGEFHPGPPPKAGLWNPDFRPLRSPQPLLAIRHMVPSDLPFLADDRDLVAAYLEHFGAVLPAGLQARAAAAAARHGLAGVPQPEPQPQGVR